MASCKYNPGINSVNPYAVLNVTQQSQSMANNTTTLRYELLLYRPSRIKSDAPKAYSIQIDGKTVKTGTTTIGGSGTKSIVSDTYTVTHDSKGEKTITFGFSLAFDIDWNVGHIGTGKASSSMPLTTIHRATTPTLSPSNLNLGSTINISLPRASSSFTHNLSWKFGELTGTIGTGITTSASLETEKSWASQIPNGSSGIGYIYCDTYNGGNVQVNQQITILVESYIDESGRQYEKDYSQGLIEGEPTFPYTNAEYINIPYNESMELFAGNITKKAYEWLKKQEKYKDAMDI